MNGLNGIIIDGVVYEVTPKGSYHCSDCSLFEQCHDGLTLYDICNAFRDRTKMQTIFRFSQSLTDKINGNGIQQEDSSAGL